VLDTHDRIGVHVLEAEVDHAVDSLRSIVITVVHVANGAVTLCREVEVTKSHVGQDGLKYGIQICLQYNNK
jgi:hypothetical protein